MSKDLHVPKSEKRSYLIRDSSQERLGMTFMVAALFIDVKLKTQRLLIRHFTALAKE
jgi:hypothetical protein